MAKALFLHLLKVPPLVWPLGPASEGDKDHYYFHPLSLTIPPLIQQDWRIGIMGSVTYGKRSLCKHSIFNISSLFNWT